VFLLLLLLLLLLLVLLLQKALKLQKRKQSSMQSLTGAGDQKIKVIKEVRGITSLGLKEAKALVEGAPQPIKEGVTKEEAEEIKGKIEAVGGISRN
jgi:ribosomal protein L7/L12